MKVEARVDARSVQIIVKELREIEPRVTRKLQQRLQVGLGDVVTRIQSEIPKTPPIQAADGRPSMSHRGRSRWRGANKPQVKFYGGGMRGKFRNLVVIEVTGGASKGFDYAELAGIRPRSARSNESRPYTRRGSSGTIRHKVTTQGDEFIAALQRAKPIPGKAGRFAYDAFLKSRVQIIGKTVQILDEFMAEYNKKFDVRMGGQ